MKRVLILIIIAFSFLLVNARQPYGDYIVRYIVTDATTYKPIYNPLKITHMGIRVENTNAGVKTWEAEYRGVIDIHGETFHKFYLTNQYVEFNISDRRFLNYQGKKYYAIIFDGQLQIAEPRTSVDNSNQTGAEWQHIGIVQLVGAGDFKFLYEGNLYVRVIQGRTFYKVIVYGKEYSVVRNHDENRGEYKYKAGDMYLNID